jgi:hypothetical protein
MKKRPPRVLAPRKTSVSRADMLWLLHTLGEAEASGAASLAGFHWAGAPKKEEPDKKPPPPEPPKPPPEPDMRRPPLRATHFALVEYQSFPDLDVETKEAPASKKGPIYESFDGTEKAAPKRIPLSPPRRMAVFLRQSLRTTHRGREIDVARLIGHLSRVSLPRHLPRRALCRWGQDAALVIDLSLPAFPLTDDLIDLAEQAASLSSGRLTILCHTPVRGWLRRQAGPEAVWELASEADLLTSRHWLLAGDMASLSGDDTTRRRWRRRLKTHFRAGGQATLLAGYAATDWKECLPRQSRLALWDHGRRLVPARPGGGCAANLPRSEGGDVARLLAALSLAVRVEPPLLREIRLYLGLSMACELAAWNHADVDHCHLGMQIRPERLSVYRAQSRQIPLSSRRRVAQTIQGHHLGICSLIRMEEAALAADLAELDQNDAAAQWATALRTLEQVPGGIAASQLASYLGRTGWRAHEGLWQAVPELADAYVVARRNELLAGAAVPTGLPSLSLSRHLPPGGGAKEAGPLWIVQSGACLLALTRPPEPAEFKLAESSPTDGFDLATPAKGRHWHGMRFHSLKLDELKSGAGPWTIQTPWVKAVIAEIPRPSWAIEWGRDREGLYAVAPSPIGAPVKLRWLIVEPRPGYAEGTIREQISPGRGFQARPGYPAPGVALGVDPEFGLHLDLTIGDQVQRFRYIEPGEFTMGSPVDEAERLDDEGPQHLVRLTEGYWLAETACSQALWQAVTGGNPSTFKDDPQNPVEQVSWDDVDAFLRRLEALLPGVKAELPTEAEWEYACRAGTKTAFSFDDAITSEQANYDGDFSYDGGPRGEYRQKTVPVKTFAANPWGLYQMHGNVLEWCADGGRTYDGALQTDPRGGEGDTPRALRGGSWFYGPGWLRSAYRYGLERDWRNDDARFRFSLRSTSPEGGAERLPEATFTRDA